MASRNEALSARPTKRTVSSTTATASAAVSLASRANARNGAGGIFVTGMKSRWWASPVV